MLTNKQIQLKEIYKTQQMAIKANKDLKEAQQEFIYSCNAMIASIYINKANLLNQSICKRRFSKALDIYTKSYLRKLNIEADLHELRYNLDKAEDR